DEHWLLLVLHELAVDGRSVRLLLRELAALYGQVAAEGVSEVVSSPDQYEEVVARGAAVSVQQDQQCQYWLEQLAGAPPVLELPADHPRPAQRNGEGARMPLTVPPELVAQLEVVNRRDNCSLFVTLLSGFATLLHRYTRCSDLVIGTVAAGAMADLPEDLVFNADNLLALRCRLEGNPTFREVVRRMNETTTEAMAHGDVPFFEVVRRVNLRCQPGYARVFQTALVLEPELVPESSFAPIQFQPLAIDNRTSKLDLLLHLVRGAGQVSGWIEYRSNLFEPARISRLIEHWLTLLTAAAANPEQSISTLPLMASAETTRVLVEWNQTQRPYSLEQTIPGLFLAQARRSPKAEALVAGEARWTYQQLEARSRQIAVHLQRLGAGPERLVGVC
ncbi:MAG: condensation domain-containing protein, partial [Limisphaerales bacterium]